MSYFTVLQTQYLINAIFMILGILYFLAMLIVAWGRHKRVLEKKELYKISLLLTSAIVYVALLLFHIELLRLSLFLVCISLLTFYISTEIKCSKKCSMVPLIILTTGIFSALDTLTETSFGMPYHLLVDFVVASTLIFVTFSFLISKSIRAALVLLLLIVTTVNELLLVHFPWELIFYLNFASILVVGLFLALLLSYYTRASTVAAVSLFSVILIFGINLSITSLTLNRIDVFYYFIAIVYVGFALISGTVYFLNDYIRNKYESSLYLAGTFGIAYVALFIDLFATLIYDLIREEIPPFVYFVVGKIEVFVWLLGFLVFLKAGQTLLEIKKAEKPYCIFSTAILTYVILDYQESVFVHELIVFVIFVLLTLLILGIFGFIFLKAYRLGAHEEALRFLLFSIAFILISFGVLLSSVVSFEAASVTLFLGGAVYLILSPPRLFRK